MSAVQVGAVLVVHTCGQPIREIEPLPKSGFEESIPSVVSGGAFLTEPENPGQNVRGARNPDSIVLSQKSRESHVHWAVSTKAENSQADHHRTGRVDDPSTHADRTENAGGLPFTGML